MQVHFALIATVVAGFLGAQDSATRQGVENADTEQPVARHHHAGAYDRKRHRFVIFGGNVVRDGGAGWIADTWGFDGTSWIERKVKGPPGLCSHRMVYHAGVGSLMLFGGVREDRKISDATWKFDGVNWRMMAGKGPSARHSPAMGYDEKRRRTVVFGGSDRGAIAVWEWDGRDWYSIQPDGRVPPPRMRATLVFDPVRETMILFGGYLDGVSDETWEWDGRRWTELEVAGPSARANHVMATDFDRKRIVLFGGSNSKHDLYGDTWEWDGKAWGRIATKGPPARTVPAMDYDSHRRVVILHGGRGEGRTALGDTWSYNGRRWKKWETRTVPQPKSNRREKRGDDRQ